MKKILLLFLSVIGVAHISLSQGSPIVTLATPSIIIDETSMTADLSFQLTNANGTPSIIKLVAFGGSTADALDYSMPIVLTFPGNVDTMMNFTISIIDDMVSEITEYIAISIKDSANVFLNGDTIASVYIKDNEFVAPVANGSIDLEPIYTYTVSGGSAEISAYDPIAEKLFIGNSTTNTVEVLDISDPNNGVLLQSIPISTYGNLNSITVWADTIVLAMENSVDPQSNGTVVFLDAAGTLLNQVTVGAMPDMVTFTPDHTRVLSANEGEPDDNYTNDPEGSISILNISAGVANATIMTATFTSFNSQQATLEASGINIYGPGSTVAQDLEPEYIAVDENSTTAWITLQENNALAKLDIASATITDIYPLGYKDHSLTGNGMDISNTSDDILIANWPVKGMYQPDAIASFTVAGATYLVTANEGDARDYNAIEEEERIGDGSYPLDSTLYYNFEGFLKNDDNAGRLKTTNTLGDPDNDGDFDDIYSFGARSFSIWDENGILIYDSGDDLEQITAADPIVNTIFNCSNSNVNQKNRSDDKGPEPEGVAIGVINDTTYAFITLERVGGIIVYDVSDVNNPLFVQYINNRDIATATGDLAPEGIIFVPDNDSPIDTALVIVSNEVSGTVTIYKVNHTIILPPVADFSEDVTDICEGSDVSFTNASVGTQDTWEWTFSGGTPATSLQENPVITYGTAGVYPVKLIVTNVNGSDTIEMIDLITVSPIPSAPTITQIDALTLESSEPNGNQWNDQSGVISGATSQTFAPPVDGNYSVTFIDANNCSITTPFFTFSDYTSLNEYSNSQLSVYPNPVRDILSFNKTLAIIEVIDIKGKRVLEAKNKKSIDVSSLEVGMYIIQTQNGQNIKFIKE